MRRDEEKGKKRELKSQSEEEKKYLPPCLEHSGKGEECRRCIILTTGRCEQYRKKLEKIFISFQNKYGDLPSSEKSDIFNEMFERVTKRISAEDENPIRYFNALVNNIYTGTVYDYFHDRAKRGLTGFNDEWPENRSISFVPTELPALEGEEGDDSVNRSHFDKEAEKLWDEKNTRSEALERVDAAIAFLEKLATKSAMTCIRIFFCLKDVILAGGKQEDCSDSLGYRKPNTLNQAILNCRKLLKEMPL
jgi:hypothetical protein